MCSFRKIHPSSTSSSLSLSTHCAVSALKNSDCYHFNAKQFQAFIPLVLHGQISAFDIQYYVGVFF